MDEPRQLTRSEEREQYRAQLRGQMDGLPKFDDPDWKTDRLVGHAATSLALCQLLQEENAMLRAQLAAAERKLLQREGRQLADPVNHDLEMMRCTGCAELYNADLIGRGGRCYLCRAQTRTK